MSKVLVISYKNSAGTAEADIRKAFDTIAPENIKNNIFIFQPHLSTNTFVGVLNSETEIDRSTTEIISGYVRPGGSRQKLNDGSYFQIKWDAKEVKFNVDRFESKSLWYYLDEEKFILSNSQLLITSLKKSFKINTKAISWFLSSGSTGFQNAWDTDVKKVVHSNQYLFSLTNWELRKTANEYASAEINFSNKKEFLQKYCDLTKDVFLDLAKDIDISKMVLPLSGGNDSRLLFDISTQLPGYENITLANWGVEKEDNEFDDKAAAKLIAKSYRKNLKDFYLPTEIEDLNDLFDSYIRNGDCRIDHFNAYADCFKIFEHLFEENYKFIIRGDIPFTEGLDLNEKMSRAHIGIPKWTDFENYKSYFLDNFVKIQEDNMPSISRKENESLIEWRDRLYIDFRIPIVISSFDDLISSYIVTISPMMSHSHFLLYSQQAPGKRGDKAHIVALSKQLDQSKVAFDASPSILSMEMLLRTEKNISFLKDYLKTMDDHLFSVKMINSVIQKLADNQNEGPVVLKSNKTRLLNFVKHKLPVSLKSWLKAKKLKNIDALTLAYRMVLVDKVYKTFKQANQR